MRTLLRNTKTGFYFQGVDNWIPSSEDAFDFRLTERVIRFVREAGLNTNELELIVAFDDPRFNITLPIDERFGVYLAATETQAQRVFS